MQKRLDGKVAVVTGASSGIGHAIVESYVAEGARVAAFGRDVDALDELQAAHPESVIAVSGDATRADELQRLVDGTVKAFGGVDIVVPNAGIARVVSFEESTPRRSMHSSRPTFSRRSRRFGCSCRISGAAVRCSSSRPS